MHPGSTDLIVVGGGIVGMAHTLAALDAGLSVRLIERTRTPAGASIRNFGMVWPIGMPSGERLELAMRTRELWIALADRVGFDLRPCGSLHLARFEDEWRVLEEFHRREGARRGIELIDPESARELCPAVRTEGLLGAMHSRTELVVDPREAIARTFDHLRAHPRATVHHATAVLARDGAVTTADGGTHHAAHVLICSGADLETLHPERLARYPISKCKLQMMRTPPQPGGFRLNTHIASGLTLNHYPAFEGCPSLDQVRERFERDHPDLGNAGIHVLVSQNARGEVVIGDSHTYGPDAELPDIDDRINDLILRELGELIELPEPAIAARWVGVYPKLTDGSICVVDRVDDRTTIVTGIGGVGMTLSLALGERTIRSLGPARAAASPSAQGERSPAC